ncbi:hypothetical protein EXIGLDRAFT_728047 [Exidia glandulosa HHB12029]|uniref:Uncharacterized protein n=1 Tax=Exidia glandulosa HHB12029 TaxID=1314781 RepID=A0A165D3H5_EXIGL|nr:hypothetical protein EXIGLDRAFT_728047 [Exidia glandulosa HHB12029]
MLSSLHVQVRISPRPVRRRTRATVYIILSWECTAALPQHTTLRLRGSIPRVARSVLVARRARLVTGYPFRARLCSKLTAYERAAALARNDAVTDDELTRSLVSAPPAVLSPQLSDSTSLWKVHRARCVYAPQTLLMYKTCRPTFRVLRSVLVWLGFDLDLIARTRDKGFLQRISTHRNFVCSDTIFAIHASVTTH